MAGSLDRATSHLPFHHHAARRGTAYADSLLLPQRHLKAEPSIAKAGGTGAAIHPRASATFFWEFDTWIELMYGNPHIWMAP